MINSALLVGDLHVQLSNLEDTRRVFSIITDSALKYKPQYIIFTGDIYHTHAVLRQEIIDVVQHEMSKLRATISTETAIYVIVGNHDGYSPTSTQINAARQTLSEFATIIDDNSGPRKIPGYYLVGYKHAECDFISSLGKIEDEVIVCHQTFNGAKYDNGFYAPDGFDLSKIKNKIISGHIHSEQEFGNVIYIGTPRAVNFGEAVNLNKPDSSLDRKSISLFYFENDELKREKIYTDEVVKNYYKLSIEEGFNPDVDQIKQHIKGLDSEIMITARGSQEWYDHVTEKYNSLGIKTKFVPHIIKHLESTLTGLDGNFSIDNTLKEYIFEIYNDADENKEKIWKTLQIMME